MGFMFMLVLATLAAYTQATLTYGFFPFHWGTKPRMSIMGSPFRRLGSSYYNVYKPKFNAGRLLHETVFYPRRVGLSFGLGGGRMADRLGLGGRTGQSDCFPRCRYDEECVSDSLKGRPYCQRKSPFQGGSSPVSGGSGNGGRTNACYDNAYPNDCVSTSKDNGITRYTFHDGYCQEFSCDNGHNCEAQGHANNIFNSSWDCQKDCSD